MASGARALAGLGVTAAPAVFMWDAITYISCPSTSSYLMQTQLLPIYNTFANYAGTGSAGIA
jgi:hypothetical protein